MEVYKDTYYEVETNAGTEIVPASLVTTDSTDSTNAPLAADPERLIDFLEGTPLSWELIEPQRGFVARMTMPGYMDSTAWSAHESREKAIAYLDHHYGGD